MKKVLLFIFICFQVAFYSNAQHFSKDDTVVVFHVSRDFVVNRYIEYIPFKKYQTLQWVDDKNMTHSGEITEIKSTYLMIGSDTVRPAMLKGLMVSSGMFPMSANKNISYIIYDSSYNFNVMRYIDFTIIDRPNRVSMMPRSPMFEQKSSAVYKQELTISRDKRDKRLAALDTCPLHYGIKTNFLRDVINEINLSFEMPVKRNICIDFGAGLLYAKNNPARYDFSNQLSSISEIKSNTYYWFDHSYYNRKGFTLDATAKFFLSKFKNLYLGPQVNYRYYYYDHKWIYVNANGSDYYYEETHAVQSERSSSIHLNLVLGMQNPMIKRFIFDSYIAIGVMYRNGNVHRYLTRTYLHEGSYYEYYDPYETFKGGSFSPSFSIGIKIGYRFGKLRLKK